MPHGRGAAGFDHKTPQQQRARREHRRLERDHRAMGFGNAAQREHERMAIDNAGRGGWQ